MVFTLWDDARSVSGDCLSPCKAMTVLLTVVLMLCLTPPGRASHPQDLRTCSLAVCTFNPLYFFHFPHPPLLSGNHSLLSVSMSLFVLFDWCFLDSINETSYSICLSLTYFTWQNTLWIHPCWKWLSNIPLFLCVCVSLCVCVCVKHHRHSSICGHRLFPFLDYAVMNMEV